MVTVRGVQIPHLEALQRFDPAFLTDGDLDDASSFFGLPKEQCRERIVSYSSLELAERWSARTPRTPSEITAFYRKADLYIWELMQWHASRERRPYWAALAYLSRHFPPESGFRRVLDFGCGIGTDSLFLARAGYDVTLVDVDGPGFRFARHRFVRRNLPARFLTSCGPLPEPDGVYDVIVCFDVFEHLPDPLEGARRLVRALRPGGLLVARAAFADEGGNPCHLRSNLRRFGGLRWHIHLAGLGLRTMTDYIYVKSRGLERRVQHSRFLLWKLTGLWPVFVGRRDGGGSGGPE